MGSNGRHRLLRGFEDERKKKGSVTSGGYTVPICFGKVVADNGASEIGLCQKLKAAEHLSRQVTESFAARVSCVLG